MLSRRAGLSATAGLSCSLDWSVSLPSPGRDPYRKGKIFDQEFDQRHVVKEPEIEHNSLIPQGNQKVLSVKTLRSLNFGNYTVSQKSSTLHLAP